MQLENLEPASPPRKQTIDNELEHSARSEHLRKDRFLSDGNIFLPDPSRICNEIEERHKKHVASIQELRGSPKHDPLRTNKKSHRLLNTPPGPDHKTKSGKKGKRLSDEENKDGLVELLDMHRSPD